MVLKPEMKITVTRNGPYVVTGNVPLNRELAICDRDGTPVRWEAGERYPDRGIYSLCRCGKSANKPYCDGAHLASGFKDAEHSPKQPEPFFEEADVIEGPGVTLYDYLSLCATGRFCHRGGDVWKLAATASDRESVECVIRDACDCPSGRLVAADRETGKPIEPDLKPEISLIELPGSKISGPLWVKGGIVIESIGGWQYEVRNRVTLCRCGTSRNMPFCDGSHISIGFNDGTEEVS
ncbi:MAG: CDGSH iron-sulfur domain-containing protein [Actinobacteria bacterium]|nr:CDGSH iron-sulfur domain-containing protein [Actinomycetota bacterium]